MYTGSGSDFYQTGTAAQEQVFQKLKRNIERLKGQQRQLQEALSVDRNDLSNVQSAMNQLQRQMQQKQNLLNEKARNLSQISNLIQQTEQSYNLIIRTTTKLADALQNQGNHLRKLTNK